MKFRFIPTYTAFQSPLGPMTLAAHQNHLVGVWFDGQKHHPDTAAWQPSEVHPVLIASAEQLRQYFAGQRSRFDLPLDLSSGSEFQQQVWRELLTIAPGRTPSYGMMGQRIGKPSAVRAVAAAIGRNPISIVVPCHRVVGAKGALTGYAGGLDRKAALLQIESTF
jgi:methylated-DNA-[protein]-cysteine S-methyltransferase